MTHTLFAQENGDGSETIVLLHGFGSFHGMWDRIATALSPDFRTLAYDLPGHAGSLDWPQAGPAKVAIRAILADLEARQIGRAHLVGHSMGGAFAALAAISRPELAASLTLLAPGGIGEQINGPLLRRYAAARSKAEIRSCLTQMSGPHAVVPDNLVQALERMRAQPGQTGKLVEIAAAMTKGDRQGVIAREMLAALPMPVCVAWGTEDAMLPFSQTAHMPVGFALWPLPGAGHMLVEETPDHVVEIIRQTVSK
ncbi:alpha/beta fold hydrolase [Pseudaminobacter sp. NGMCC 1.201702]|uniref:alpha/beta fold hydrolase n=1 Tax=Pseudaminobacter sp. NGMCC 1.201702 TaxID=3391825 RepID=UPI0039F0679A